MLGAGLGGQKLLPFDHPISKNRGYRPFCAFISRFWILSAVLEIYQPFLKFNCHIRILSAIFELYQPYQSYIAQT
ncbi:hypothetical protein CFK37_00265 [Virgibacillus phasianinus]|uniref:Uncharacterized protein n=1 Tax=Virgibacillus phasianinus TaxID=2017483 RepID=A0A220TYB4_9BACI|nr:hypothetical protein CFK37_00265 [Virgibacillus phasianinus]